MNYNLRSKIYGLVVLGCVAFAALDTKSAPLALLPEVVHQTKSYFTNLMADQEPLKKIYSDYFIYLQQLTADPRSTLALSPDKIPATTRSFHETFQFYFDNRTQIDGRDITTLLHPPLPLTLKLKRFSDDDQRALELDGIRIRTAWFNLFNGMGPKAVLEADSSSMISVTLIIQFLNDFSVNKLNGLLDTSDFITIMETLGHVPTLSDEYLQQLALAHDKASNGSDIFSRQNRILQYKQIARQLSVIARIWYYDTWSQNPALFETRIKALKRWIDNDLDNVADILNAVSNLDKGKGDILQHCEKYIGASLNCIDNAKVPDRNGAVASKRSKLSEDDLALVRELNYYLRYHGQQFDVDYVTKSSKALSALQSNDSAEYLKTTQLDDLAANLTLPIEIFTDYAKHSTNSVFSADLVQFRARLEGLQDAAKSLRR